MAFQFNHVSFSYGDKEIFHDLSFSFPSKGFVIFLGKSGCGKTTFLSLLEGVLLPTEGTVIKEEAGIVFQSPLLLNYLSVKENILLYRRLKGKKEKIDEILKEVNLTGYEDRDVTTLSGGEQMRVSLARALALESSALILDEPTGQLDEKNSKQIYEILKHLSQKKLIILVTHDEKNALNLADELYRMEKGKLITLKKSPITKRKERKTEKSKNHLSFKESLFLAKAFLRKRKVRTYLCTIFLSFVLSLVYLGLNVRKALPHTVENILSEYYAPEVVKIQKRKDIASQGKLHLFRYAAFSQEDLVLLNVKESYVPLNYFLPEMNQIRVKNKEVTASFYPFFDQKQERIKEGRKSQSFPEVIVNESFLSEAGLDQEIFVSFSLDRQVLVRSNALKESDLISLPMSFDIVGISKEKKAFNKPIVYYSYFGLYGYLSDIYLENISKEKEKDTYVTDLLEDKDYLQDDFSGQGNLFRSMDYSEQEKAANQFFDGEVKFTSQAKELKESTSSLLDSLTQVLMLFLGLNLLSAFMLEFLTFYSFYRDDLRLFALLKSTTQKKGILIKAALGILFRLLGYILVFLLAFSLLFSSGVNAILLSLDYPSFLSFFSFESFLLVLLLALFVSLFSSLLPFRRIKDTEIKKELEGED